MRSGNGQSPVLDASSRPQILSFISETFYLFSRMLYSTMSDAGAKTTVKKIGQSLEAPAGSFNQNLVVFEVVVAVVGLLCRLICFLLSLSWLILLLSYMKYSRALTPTEGDASINSLEQVKGWFCLKDFPGLIIIYIFYKFIFQLLKTKQRCQSLGPRTHAVPLVIFGWSCDF